MKKILAAVLSVMMIMSSFAVIAVDAAQEENEMTGASISFKTDKALFVHAVAGADDTEAWQGWQSLHDGKLNFARTNEKYFFLPSSADDSRIEIYNGFSQSIDFGGETINAGEAKIVTYNVSDVYSVIAEGTEYTLKFMKSTAEAAIYINNSDADGSGTPLIEYLNQDKSLNAPATGAVVDADGSIDNTEIKKIKGRGNSTWTKAKKPYNITYKSNVSVAGMAKSKKYSLLANYQDDSFSRNRFLYDLSDAVGMPYASDSRYVDFYSNGFYWGSYQMTEKIEVGKNNVVNDIDDTAYLNSDGTINKDFPFLCEVDASANEDEDYVVKCDNGITLTVKAPELEPGDVGYEEVKNYIREKFNAFAGAAKNPSSNLSDYADIDSVTKLYLINELGKNWDSGVSSTFFVYKKDAVGKYKFYGSPVWDYDNSLGNATGVESELNYIGVKDYEEYSGWWCKFKGKAKRDRSSNNIMNNIARHTQVLETAPQIWFEDFVPAIDYFAGNKSESSVSDEFYSSEKYYNLIKGSAEMNYKSGWLLDTGGWICDHSSLNNAKFDMSTGTYTVNSSVTKYDSNFDGMYRYCRDWLISRTAWLSSQMFDSYTPRIKGDVDGDGVISIMDATAIQKYVADMVKLTDTQLIAADLNGDGLANILDATEIQKIIAEII